MLGGQTAPVPLRMPKHRTDGGIQGKCAATSKKEVKIRKKTNEMRKNGIFFEGQGHGHVDREGQELTISNIRSICFQAAIRFFYSHPAAARSAAVVRSLHRFLRASRYLGRMRPPPRRKPRHISARYWGGLNYSTELCKYSARKFGLR